MTTIIDDHVRRADAVAEDGRVLVEPDALPGVLGWELKPEGLCRGDVCVPVRDRASLFAGERLDIAAVADALRQPIVVDADANVVALALPAEQRRQVLAEHHAAPFTLDDLDGAPHSLAEWAGKKKLLVAFATW
jgi:hypothetical protein